MWTRLSVKLCREVLFLRTSCPKLCQDTRTHAHRLNTQLLRIYVRRSHWNPCFCSFTMILFRRGTDMISHVSNKRCLILKLIPAFGLSDVWQDSLSTHHLLLLKFCFVLASSVYLSLRSEAQQIYNLLIRMLKWKRKKWSCGSASDSAGRPWASLTAVPGREQENVTECRWNSWWTACGQRIWNRSCFVQFDFCHLHSELERTWKEAFSAYFKVNLPVSLWENAYHEE